MCRAYLVGRLREDFEGSWHEGHCHLYKLYAAQCEYSLPEPTTDKSQLEKLQRTMMQLSAAAYHGCQAGKRLEVFKDVYWGRMQRGSDRFNTYMLGTPSLELVALANILDALLGDRVEGENLDEEALTVYAVVLEERGLQYWHLGRFREATEALCMARTELIRNFGSNEVVANDLAMIERRLGEIYLYWGNMDRASYHTGEAVKRVRKYEDKHGKEHSKYLSGYFDEKKGIEPSESINWYEPVDVRVQRARVLGLSNRPNDAEKLFDEAEELAKEMRDRPHMRYVWLLWYAEFLIDIGKFEDALTKRDMPSSRGRRAHLGLCALRILYSSMPTTPARSALWMKVECR